jgi:hypothetical protein
MPRGQLICKGLPGSTVSLRSHPKANASLASMLKFSAPVTLVSTATILQAWKMRLLISFLVRVTYTFLILNVPNRSFRSTPTCGPGIISYRVPRFYSFLPPCSSPKYRRTAQGCQRTWDDSFPPDPLSPVRRLHELGRRPDFRTRL